MRRVSLSTKRLREIGDDYDIYGSADSVAHQLLYLGAIKCDEEGYYEEAEEDDENDMTQEIL